MQINLNLNFSMPHANKKIDKLSSHISSFIQLIIEVPPTLN
jgi:hypothetical protein